MSHFSRLLSAGLTNNNTDYKELISNSSPKMVFAICRCGHVELNKFKDNCVKCGYALYWQYENESIAKCILNRKTKENTYFYTVKLKSIKNNGYRFQISKKYIDTTVEENKTFFASSKEEASLKMVDCVIRNHRCDSFYLELIVKSNFLDSLINGGVKSRYLYKESSPMYHKCRETLDNINNIKERFRFKKGSKT
jgi:ribosomal protein L37E